MSNKAIKQSLAVIEAEGVRIVSIHYGRHLIVHAEFLGQSLRFVASKTPSDHRTTLNLRADVRRQVKAAKERAGE